MTIEDSTVLAAVSTVIGTLFGMLVKFVKSTLDRFEKTIDLQAETISNLQEDVKRLVKGCGHSDCFWFSRDKNNKN
jgi:uncharacterized protein YoxC